MKALVLEKAGQLTLRDIQIEENLGASDVRVKVHTVGICGSDVHYYRHGAIGPFVAKQPMVLDTGGLVGGADSSKKRHTIRPGY